MSNIRSTDADTVDGKDASELAKSDSDIRAAVDGSNVSVGDADRVDGQDASELAGELSVGAENFKFQLQTNTQVTNNTGDPFYLGVTARPDGVGIDFRLTVDGTTVQRQWAEGDTPRQAVGGIVPAGSTYVVEFFNGSLTRAIRQKITL